MGESKLRNKRSQAHAVRLRFDLILMITGVTDVIFQVGGRSACFV